MTAFKKNERKLVLDYEQRQYLYSYQFKLSYLHPKYWLTWLGMGFYRLLGLLPFKAFVFVGERLGDTIYYLAKSRVKFAKCNIETCFPEKSAAEQQAMLRENFRNFGVGLIEPGIAWWASRRRIESLVRVEGLEYLYETMKQGRGVLLCAEHMVNMEITLRRLGDIADFALLYREQKNPVFQYVSAKRRRQYFFRLLSREKVRDFIYFMRTGRVGLILPDQDFGKKRSIFVPFFGVSTATVPSVSKFSKQADVSVVFVHFYREGTQGYVMKMLPTLTDFPTNDEQKDTARINTLIEEAVREHPTQYLWQHRRFKSRPDGEPSLYK